MKTLSKLTILCALLQSVSWGASCGLLAYNPVTNQLDCTGTGAAANPAGANTQVQFNSGGVFGASANLTWVSPLLTIGVAGSATGQLALTGATSGTITIQGQSAAGTYNLNLPTTAGTSGYFLTSGGGGTNPNTWTQPTGTGNVVMSASPTLTGTLTAAAATLSGLLNLSSGNFTVPTASGFTATSTNMLGYDNAAGATNFHIFAGADKILAPVSGALTTGHCPQFSITGTNILLVDSGSANCGGGGSTAWNNITNAAGALTLANAGNATTFNQTSAVNWTWANTTAATNVASQSSPIFNIAGTYWTGAASAADTWTVQNVVGNGTNGTTTLTFGHSGTSASANVSFPGSVNSGTGSGIAGAWQCLQGAAATVQSNAFGWTCPTTMTTSVLLQSPNAVPAANQIMLFPAPTSNVSQWTWTNFNLTGMGATFSSPLSLSTNTVTCPTCTTNAAALTLNHVVLGGGAQAAVADANLDDGATTANTLTYGGSAGIASTNGVKTGAAPPACTAGTAGLLCLTEGTDGTNVAGAALIDANSTSHELVAKTNGSSSAGMLTRAQPGAVSLTGQTAAIANGTALCAAAAGACNTAGLYRVTFYFTCSATGTGNIGATITYTDEVGAKTAQTVPISVAGSATLATTMALNATTQNATGTIAFWSTGAAQIGYGVTDSGTGTYAVRAVVERVGL